MQQNVRVLVITSPMVNVINHFQCYREFTSYIQFIKTSCIYLGTLFLKLLGNFEIDFKPYDQFQERGFVWVGGGHHDICLLRAPEGDKTALLVLYLFDDKNNSMLGCTSCYCTTF